MAGADLIIRPPRLHFLIRLRRAFKHLSHDVVAALWAQIEYTIDLKINEALALRDAPKINPKLMIPFNKRLEVLDALCRRFLENPDDRISAAKIVQDLKQLSSLRNLIVHGSIRNSEQRRKGRRVYWFRRM